MDTDEALDWARKWRIANVSRQVWDSDGATEQILPESEWVGKIHRMELQQVLERPSRQNYDKVRAATHVLITREWNSALERLVQMAAEALNRVKLDEVWIGRAAEESNVGQEALQAAIDRQYGQLQEKLLEIEAERVREREESQAGWAEERRQREEREAAAKVEAAPPEPLISRARVNVGAESPEDELPF